MGTLKVARLPLTPGTVFYAARHYLPRVFIMMNKIGLDFPRLVLMILALHDITEKLVKKMMERGWMRKQEVEYLIRCKRFFSKDLNLRLLRLLRFFLFFAVPFRSIFVLFHGKRNTVSFKLHIKDRDHYTLVNPYHLAGVFHEVLC